MNFAPDDHALLEDLKLGRPLIDVRAPVEFAKGAVPGAVNLPLLNDEERAQIGTVYKQKGSEAAIRLGHVLVSGERREQRIQAWLQYSEANPRALLYCFRGGLRSRSVREALSARGRELDLIEGGYKRIRGLLMKISEEIAEATSFAVLSGFTGSGKTDLLRTFKARIPTCDLEGLAHHKGSAFGHHRGLPQPSQSDFENRLALALYSLRAASTILVEDESRMIGYNVIPPALFKKMSAGPVFVMDVPRADRAEYLAQSYVQENIGAGEGLTDRLSLEIQSSLGRIRRRLGGDEYRILSEMSTSALREHAKTGEVRAHVGWVERLLEKYYDPLYDYHLARIQNRIVVRGSRKEVQEALTGAGRWS